jgi:hypothetical protein
MVKSHTISWYIMSSEKFRLTEEQREGITDRIRKIIRRRGYKSLREFALEWNLPENTFHNWAKKGHINLSFLINFSETFDVDLRWLIKGPPYPEEEKPKKSH